MSVWSRWLLPLLATAICAVTPVTAAGSLRGGPLTGTWSGYITGQTGSGVKRQRMVIVVNAKETGGTWQLGVSCHGPLTLESISSGYHHYLRKLARGSTCGGGDVDCLKRVGPDMYDAVTSHLGGAWGESGTFRRVRST
jgi:hypothetical protein